MLLVSVEFSFNSNSFELSFSALRVAPRAELEENDASRVCLHCEIAT